MNSPTTRQFKDLTSEMISQIFLEHPSSLLLLRCPPEFTLERELILTAASNPIFLIPECFIPSIPLFESITIPVSGECLENESLQACLQLSQDLKIPIDLIHVTGDDRSKSKNHSGLGQCTDQLHHEYPYMIQEMIKRNSPFQSEHDRRRIRTFVHLYGRISTLIREYLAKIPYRSLIAFEWKGNLEPGRALILKSILAECHFPILLFKTPSHQHAILKIGKNLKIA